MVTPKEAEKSKRVKVWAITGFCLGLLVSGVRLATGDPAATSENMGRFIGSPLGGAFWGWLLALLRNRFSK